MRNAFIFGMPLTGACVRGFFSGCTNVSYAAVVASPSDSSSKIGRHGRSTMGSLFEENGIQMGQAKSFASAPGPSLYFLEFLFHAPS